MFSHTQDMLSGYFNCFAYFNMMFYLVVKTACKVCFSVIVAITESIPDMLTSAYTQIIRHQLFVNGMAGSKSVSLKESTIALTGFNLNEY